MIPSHRKATHPGMILLKQFIEPMGITQKALAMHIGIPAQQINEIVREVRGLSPNTAWLFSKTFKTTPEFWLNLQNNYDLFCS
ncbi:antitoxin HigA-1 [Bathymodiolus japonicus methanotrophic gill symbiont]|uniref:HigA family addiction module antitoxin n=1 Tax=Bathymodiolus japonicus methanotrophic gill symbiont TaxID=113269 RepID=UPI001B4BFDB9|nr:HigA family addiction module antitoxin [Bathymodiolus japonicus methanotrophic gill symbiont]GFO73622.1 antitoxin HigA-1 [Bathymodiolus japonicus methanotrophic gill symbiont]